MGPNATKGHPRGYLRAAWLPAPAPTHAMPAILACSKKVQGAARGDRDSQKIAYSNRKRPLHRAGCAQRRGHMRCTQAVVLMLACLSVADAEASAVADDDSGFMHAMLRGRTTVSRRLDTCCE